jgi:hypothetical protein
MMKFLGKEFYNIVQSVGGLSALLSPSIMLKREKQEIPGGKVEEEG